MLYDLPFLGLIIPKISLFNDTSKSPLNYQHLAITHHEIFAAIPVRRLVRLTARVLVLYITLFD